MRSILKGLVAASAGFAMFVTPAAAADYQDDMQEMREMVLKLQDRIEAQQSQIDEQQGVIRDAGLEEERGSVSALSSFLESTDFSGWVAASYFYNLQNPNQPQVGNNTGTLSDGRAISNPFHPDHNSFQFDEAWFTIDRAPTEEMPAGFHVELVYGATASAFTGSRTDSSGGAVTSEGNGNDLWIPTANVSYMTPWGQTFTAGKFGTTIGYEVAGAANNVNITRGFGYNLFQPISHVGVTVSQDFDWGGTYTLGIVNGFGTSQPDVNQDKAFLWQVGWGNDVVTVLYNGLYAPDQTGPGQEIILQDWVVEVTPTDNLLFWANWDFITEHIGPRDPWGAVLSVGGRVGITDDLGFGARAEYARFVDDKVANPGNWPLDSDLWSVTGTVDYKLTDNLTWKIEAKFEAVRDQEQNVYRNGGSNTSGALRGTEDETAFFGTQLYYEF